MPTYPPGFGPAYTPEYPPCRFVQEHLLECAIWNICRGHSTDPRDRLLEFMVATNPTFDAPDYGLAALVGARGYG
jgi:hypothetical protein